MKLKSLVAGALLAAASVSSFAADQINIPVTLGVATGFTGLALPGDPLLSLGFDELTFTGLTAGTYNVQLNFSATNVNIQTASLNGQPPVFLWGSPSASLGSFTITTSSPFKLILGGDENSAASAFYNGSITVTAVPEPETYGMLLGGLALLGVVARRKASKAS